MDHLTTKVCGINNMENLKSLLALPVDMVGFIFYEPSKRNCTLNNEDVRAAFAQQSVSTKRVGVFVDATIEEIVEKHDAFGLDLVQLHGKENVFFCQKLKTYDIKMIKAFSVDEHFSFSNTMPYEFFCDFFLFDTKGKNPGGNGVSFDWKILDKYKSKTPFFLSGGIGPEDAERIRDLRLSHLSSVDINSVFEIEPGYKNLDIVAEFIYRLKRPKNPNLKTDIKKIKNA